MPENKFEDLVEQSTFDDLVENPEETRQAMGQPPQPQVTSSLGDPLQLIPMEMQMGSPTANRFGLTDPELYLPKDLPDLSINEGEKAPEAVKEDAHWKYIMSEEAQKAINAGRQPTIYQGSDMNMPPRIDPELLQPSAAEYLVDKLSNESVIGKASILLTGTLMAAAYGGDPMEYYRDIYDANQETINGYRPNQVQDMATGVLAVTLDLPIFEGIGAAYMGASAGAIRAAMEYTSDQLVSAGISRSLADNYVKNGLMRLNSILQSGTMLGTHSTVNNIANQFGEGAGIGEVNWGEAVAEGGHSFALGTMVGAWGVGSHFIKNSRYMKTFADGSVRGRLIQKSLAPISIGGEISVFTVGEAMLDGDRRWHEVTGKEFMNAAAVILNLKAIHSKAPLPESVGKFSAAEVEIIKSKTNDMSSRHPVRSAVENNKVGDLLKDSEVPYSIKAKLAEEAGIEYEMPVASRIKMDAAPDGRSIVRTYASDGTLLQVEKFATQSEARRFFNDVEVGISEQGRYMEMAKLKPEFQSELDRLVEQSGIENGLANEKLLEASQTLPSHRTAEQKSMVNKLTDVYDKWRTEKTEPTGEDAKPVEIFNEEAPKMGETVKEPKAEPFAGVEESLRQYTPEEIELKYETAPRLQAKLNHPVNGINKLLSDLQAIRESGDYSNATVRSKTMRNYFPGTIGETVRVKSEADAKAMEQRLNTLKTDIEGELARREKEGARTVGTGNYVLGVQGFETKAELFKELDKFPTLENMLPEVFDFETMKAVNEYEQAREGKGRLAARELRNTADRLREQKGKISPEPGTLQIRLPLIDKFYDLGIETMAQALEGGAGIVEAVTKATDVIRAQRGYTRLSAREKEEMQQELLKRWREKWNSTIPSTEELMREEPYVRPENSEKYADLTIAPDGDYVFYHYSPEFRESIDPSKSGSNKRAITSKEERAAAETVGGVTYLYTNTSGVESGVGSVQHKVKVSPERVYDANRDPLGFVEEAKARFEEKYPDRGFGKSEQVFWVGKVAAENGYDIFLADWKGKTRAHSVKEMTPDVVEGETRASDRGYVKEAGVSAESQYQTALDAINRHQDAQGKYDALYNLRNNYTNPKSDLYRNKEAITELVEASDLPAELKESYREALEVQDIPGRSVRPEGKESTGEAFDTFFQDVSAGRKGFSKVEYKPVLEIQPEQHGEFVRNYNRHRGNFDEHITKSIPGHKEIQVATGDAVVKTLPKGGKVLDIGGSENSWAKAVTETSGGKVESVTVDPNETMYKHSMKTPVEGNAYIKKPFMTGWENNPAWEPAREYDVVHESMTFQFISGDRKPQLEYIRDNVLKKDGILLMEEKFVPENKADFKDPNSQWSKNEKLKDEFKEQYFKKEELTKKKEEVLVGMNERMVPSETMEAMLKENFEHVFRYWDSGNFKGYAATNSLAKAKAFAEAMGNVGESRFSAEPVEFIKGGTGAPPKTPIQRRIDQSVKRPISKVTVNEYTALKDQIRTQVRIAKDIAQAQTAAREALQGMLMDKDFRQGLGVRTVRTLARKLTGMDPNKPGTIGEAMTYIDKAIEDAKFREELAEMDRAYERLDKQTDPSSYRGKDKKTGVQKGKGMTPETQDRLAQIRDDMLNKDWNKAQEEMNRIYEELEIMNPNDPSFEAKMTRLEELQFHGLLNGTSNPGLEYLRNRVDDISEIRKTGRTKEAAQAMIRAQERRERIQTTFDILNAGKKQVTLDPEVAANLRSPWYDKAINKLDWTFQDSWFTLLDKLSRYDKGSAPMRSYISRTFGESYIRAEQNEFVNKSKHLEMVRDKLAAIHGVTPDKVASILKRNTTELYTMEWEGADGKRQSLPITQNQAYKRWMELQDPTLIPSLTKQGYFDQFGERTAKYDALEAIMTPETRNWAEWQLNEFYPEYAKAVNDVYRQIYRTDMPIHDNYSPIFVADRLMNSTEAVDQMLQGQDIRGLAGNNHLKLRTGHAKELLLMDGDRVLMNYIDKMEFFKAWAPELRMMNGVFGDRTIRESIRQNFGEQYLQTIDGYLDKFARAPEKTYLFEQSIAYIRKNFTLGSLALKPTVFIKQLTSLPAFADNIPTGQFFVGLADFAKNPKAALDILNQSEYLRERYSKGWDRDVALAMQKDAQAMLSGKDLKFKDAMMFTVKYGDKGAIVLGGWPTYKHFRDQALKNGLSEQEAHEIGMKEFEFATRNSQQASGIGDLSLAQQRNPWVKLLTMYKTSPLQYHRKVMGAARNLKYGRGSVSENVKTLLIYHVLLPQLFQLAGNGFKWDGEDQLWALGLGNFNNLVVAGDAIQAGINEIRGLPFGYKITPVESLFDMTVKAGKDAVDVYEMIRELPETATLDEVLGAVDDLGGAIGHWSGTPVSGVVNTVKGVSDAITGNTDYPARRILGYSENALKEGYELWEIPDKVREKANKNLNDEKTPWSDLVEGEGNPTSFDDLVED